MYCGQSGYFLNKPHIFCVEEFMYSKSSACLDHKNVDNGNFGIICLGLIEAVFTNFSFCDAVHFIHKAGFLCRKHNVVAA